jgi:hypothetical protein
MSSPDEADRSVATATLALIAAVVAAAVAIAIGLGPIHRGIEFHRFVSDDDLAGIPHALNVLSNLPFLGVALWAWRRLRGTDAAAPARAVCLGIAAIGLGSGAYHLHLTDEWLVFDFIPIVVTLALLTGAVVGDRVSRPLGAMVAWGFSLVAIAASVAWYLGGGTAGGDLRWYVTVQATLVILPPLVASVVRERGQVRASTLAWALVAFALVRAFAAGDQFFHDLIGVSGHVLKHLAAAAASALAVSALLPRRQPAA